MSAAPPRKPATLPRCPLCGRGVARNPRQCYRCDTIHHGSCWEYLPGCGVLGCSAEELPETRPWPRILRFWRWRARAATVFVYTGWVAGAGALVVHLYPPAWVHLEPALPPFGAVAAGSLAGAIALTWLAIFAGAQELPQDLPANPRVRRALELREAGWVPTKPWRTGLLLGGIAVVAAAGLMVHEAGGDTRVLSRNPRETLVALGRLFAMVVVPVYLFIRFTVRPLAQFRIQANRLASSIHTMRRLRAAGIH